jgi:phosphoribosyl 1,2-cyclic phosphate phosphodiesterase
MSSPELTVTILGSGTSTGVPIPGCSCAVCTSGTPQNQRTRCSVLVSFGEYNILIDTATDFRQQALRENIRRIDAVLYTHTHADHVNGIDDLRPFNLASGRAIPIYACGEDLDSLRSTFSYIFSENSEPGYRPRLEPRVVSGVFSLFGLCIVPLPLVHGPGRSLGYRIGPFAYLADCSAVPESTFDLLHDVELLIVDALRFRPHQSHLNIPQALKVAGRIGARRTVLTHLSHDVDHRVHSPMLPPVTELAFDGQRFVCQAKEG